jgi:hypothetical protein
MSSHAAPVEPRAFPRRIAIPRASAAALTTVAFAAMLAAIVF